MQRQQKLLLSLMVWSLMLCYGTTVAAVLTSSEIKKIANNSMVLLSIMDVYGKRGLGSGFVVHDGHIATNYHVVKNMLIGRAKLVGKKKWYFIGPILKTDKEHDLAVVKVTGMNAPVLRLGDSNTVKIGDPIYVAGNPSGPKDRVMEGTVTIGEIKHILTEDIRMEDKSLRGKKLQIDASIEPGSSGGPVLNESAEVIGISVGGYTGVEGEEYIPLGYNYAIAVNHLKQLAKRAGIPITSAPVELTTPPIMKHNPPSRVSIGERIPLTLNLISSKVPRQVTIFYETYDKNDNELKQHYLEMRLSSQQSASSTWPYKVNLLPQKRVGSIKYYIEVEYNNRMAFRYPRDPSRRYRIFIVDDKPPTISVLYPSEDASFTVNKKITFRAKVMDNSVVEEVHIYVLSSNDQSRKLSEEGSSDMYTTDISFSQVGPVEYYLTATDEAGKESRSKNRRLIITPSDTTPPTIRLIKPNRTTFEVNQQIPIEAEVTDGSSVKQVRLFYGFSPSISDEPTHYSDEFLTETSSDTYTGHIPPQSKAGYIEYYLTATDEAGKESQSQPRHIEITLPPLVTLPKPEHPRPVMLDTGIKLYEQARYSEAIEVLNSVIQEIENPIYQAEAYLYLGSAKRGLGASNDIVKEEFRKAIRHNPNQELPHRVGEDHPIFAELLGEVRKELTGELTVISLVPQTEIWIEGNNIDKKMLGSGRVRSRLLKGSYTVEGIYAGGSQRETVTIELDRHEILYIPPIVEHTPPSSISVNERIPLRLNLIGSEVPQQVTINYKVYDREGNELAQNNQGLPLWERQSASSTWIYTVGLPSQKRIGLIEYYIEIGYDNRMAFRYPRDQSRHYRIPILDNKQPIISVLYPPVGARFNPGQQINLRAEVIDNGIVEEVRIHSDGQSQKLSAEGSPDTYAIDITLTQAGAAEYYLTATDEAGNKSRSENRGLTIKDPNPPSPPTHPRIHLIKPSSTTFHVNQQIPIEAKVTDDTSVEQVRLFYSFSPSISESPRYSDKPLTETLSDTYTGHIPPQSKAGYIWYYLSATDEAGNKSTSENRWLEIVEKSPPRPPAKPPTISLLDPPEDAKFMVNQQITFRAEVTDDTAVKEVLVHFSPGDSQTMSEEGSSGIYAVDISFSQAGSVEYYLTATDEDGNGSRSESREIKLGQKPPNGGLTDDDETDEDELKDYPIYQGIWAGVSVDDAFISGSAGSYMFRLAYMREGKGQPTLGAQLDFSPDRSNMSAMFQWGPALRGSKVAFTLLGGIVAYEDSPRSTHTTPIFGGGLKFYPRDKIVIDATGSFKLRSDYDTTNLYHYEVGIRFYITPELGLRAGYGKLYLGDEDITTLQIGIGVNF